jgi:hypothetical protein
LQQYDEAEYACMGIADELSIGVWFIPYQWSYN